ncbi:tripartite tricarboxylate transporter substrate-binding protein, partial [Acidovorax sp. NPDC077664]|uniref:tripartite tricarboxylate transporter substrate-binding protein n=1 Tax=Acidovorax sp. NPDC077664 TaxID=3390544 RepID=UPI003CFDF7A1
PRAAARPTPAGRTDSGACARSATARRTWLAMVAPRGLPPAVKSRLELTLAQVVSDPDTRDKMIAVGFEPAYASSKAVAELIDKELPLMRAIAQRASITAD